MSNENSLIEWMKSQVPSSSGVIQGIGDDAAIFGDQYQSWLVSCDTLNDRTHFDTMLHDPHLIGRKALAVSVSDMAAMGGIPKFAVVGVSLPRRLGEPFAKKVFMGIQNHALAQGVTLIGGDTTVWDGELVISTTVIGSPHRKGSALRSHGRPNDRIFITGPVGGSLIKQRHLTFEPRVKLAHYLMDHYAIHAMMDLSDGLAMDLPRLASASNCGFQVHVPKIPIHRDVNATTQAERQAAALCDGEDFELIFTTDQETALAINHDSFLQSCGIQEIGFLNDQRTHLFLDHEQKPFDLKQTGYEHRFT